MTVLGAIMAAIAVGCILGYAKIILGGHDYHSWKLGVLAYVLFVAAIVSAGIAGMELDEGALGGRLAW